MTTPVTPPVTPEPMETREQGPHEVRAMNARPDRRGWIGKSLHYVLGPIYFWLDLYTDGTRTPSMTKIMTGVSFVIGCAVTGVMTTYTIKEKGSVVALFGFVVFLVFASYGLRGLRLWKNSGQAEMMGRVAQAEPARLDAVAGDRKITVGPT